MGTEMSVSFSTENIQKIVDTHIQLAVSEALGKDPDAMVARVVHIALNEKPDRYSRDNETKFVTAVNGMIRQAAREGFQEWLDENKDLIKKAIQTRLQKKPQKFINEIADKIVAGVGSSFRVSASVEFVD